MDQKITGAMIKALRQKHRLTQAQLAQRLHISDKTVSKWENGKGCPDISLLEPIAAAFDITVSELMTGRAVSNVNVAANMLRSHFYVCPVCQNVIHAMGEAAIACHGLPLTPARPKPADEAHSLSVETVEDEYFITVPHPMGKGHYVTFLAAMGGDRLQLVRLYPEGSAEARFKMNGVRRVFFYCSRHGLFYQDIKFPRRSLAQTVK